MSISLTRSQNVENLAARLPRGRQIKREGQQLGLPTSDSKRTKHSALSSLQNILPNRPTIRVKKSVVLSAADKAKQAQGDHRPHGGHGPKLEKKGARVAARQNLGTGRGREDQENINPDSAHGNGSQKNRKSFFSNPFTKKKVLGAKQEEPTAPKPRPAVPEKRKTADKPLTSQTNKGTRLPATSQVAHSDTSKRPPTQTLLSQLAPPNVSRCVPQSHLAAPQMKRRPLGQLPTQPGTNSDSSSSSDVTALARYRQLPAGLNNQSLNSSFLNTFSKMNTADQLANQRAGKENPMPAPRPPTEKRPALLTSHLSISASCQLIQLPETTEVSLTPLKNDIIMLSPPHMTSTPVDPLTDIDSLTTDHTYCPEYASEIFLYLKKCEIRYMPRPAYLTRQQDINEGMRSILVDWLVEVTEEYKLTSQTLYLAVNYIDRFLSSMSVSRSKLQLVGTCCLYVASKFEEIYPPELSEFVYITDDTYSKGQVIKMEALLLKALEFNLLAPTAHMFAERFVRSVQPGSDKLRHLLSYLCELALLHHKIAIRFSPSMIAAASLSIAAETLRCDPWTGQMVRYTGYSWEDLQECRSLLLDQFRSAPNLLQQAVQEKYRGPEKSGVSQLRPVARQVSI